jgi:hypothetical protein
MHGTGVSVDVWVALGVGVRLGVGEGVCVDVGSAVLVEDGDAVTLGVRDGVGVKLGARGADVGKGVGTTGKVGVAEFTFPGKMAPNATHRTGKARATPIARV